MFADFVNAAADVPVHQRFCPRNDDGQNRSDNGPHPVPVSGTAIDRQAVRFIVDRAADQTAERRMIDDKETTP